MHVKFWGTRGSIAKPGPAFVRYGGNTSCVEVRSDAGTLIVIDCGTGGHPLGQRLCAEKSGPVNGHIFISHTHWDHIQGIPFFAPLFIPGNTWEIFGPKGLSQSLKATLAGQMEHSYFPVSLDQFAANIRYHDLVEGTFFVGDIKITARYLNHPALTLGYRMEADGVSIVYCCDHEPHSSEMASGNHAITGSDRRHLDFIANADLVIHDAQYTASEYAAKIGWGHSSVEYAIRICKDAGVKQVALTHHDPMREDTAVDQIVDRIRLQLQQEGSSLEMLAAYEGLGLHVEGDSSQPFRPMKDFFPAQTALDSEDMSRPILLFMEKSKWKDLLFNAITAEQIPCQIVTDAAELLPLMLTQSPALVLMEHEPPRTDALNLIRALRRGEGTGRIWVPIVLVSERDQLSSEDRSVATDVLTAPFSMSYARSKIRAWVLRMACRWAKAPVPTEETQRVNALRNLEILDTPAEERFDRMTRIAAAALGAPTALISLVDSDRQWFKSRFGLHATETPRDRALCAHVVHMREELIVRDTMQDDRFAENPLVLEEPRIRFYAGAPLILRDGSCVGSFCVIDTRPRDINDAEMTILRDLRDVVVEELQRKLP